MNIVERRRPRSPAASAASTSRPRGRGRDIAGNHAYVGHIPRREAARHLDHRYLHPRAAWSPPSRSTIRAPTATRRALPVTS
jgi:hypothetical protein